MGVLSITALIEKKRDGEELTEQEIKFFISAVTSGEAQSSQLGESTTINDYI